MTTEFVWGGKSWLNLALVAEVAPTGTGSLTVRFASRDTCDVHPPHAQRVLDHLSRLAAYRAYCDRLAEEATDELAAAVEAAP